MRYSNPETIPVRAGSGQGFRIAWGASQSRTGARNAAVGCVRVRLVGAQDKPHPSWMFSHSSV